MRSRWPQLHSLLALTLLTKSAGNLSDRTVASPSATMPPISPEDASLVNSPLQDMPLLPITSKNTVRACRAMIAAACLLPFFMSLVRSVMDVWDAMGAASA